MNIVMKLMIAITTLKATQHVTIAPKIIRNDAPFRIDFMVITSLSVLELEFCDR